MCPGWRQAGKLLQPLQAPPAPSATPAGHTAAREVTKQHLSCPILQVCSSKWDRSFCRVSHSCSALVPALRDCWVQAGPGLLLCAMTGVPHGRDTSSPILYGSSLPAQTAVDCLMLWKLTRVGEVGMDMARATRARMECLSCHRCHRFRTADRTWGVRQRRGHLVTMQLAKVVQRHWPSSSSAFLLTMLPNPAQLPRGRGCPESPCNLPGHQPCLT